MTDEEMIARLREIQREKTMLIKFDSTDADIQSTLYAEIEALSMALRKLSYVERSSIFVRGKFPTLNDYTDACRRNAHAGARMKKEAEELIGWQIAGMRKYTVPIIIHFEWHEENGKRDKDNVAFAKKFVLDAMQHMKKIPNDNNRYIAGFTDSFVYKSEYGVRIGIEIAEHEVTGNEA